MKYHKIYSKILFSPPLMHKLGYTLCQYAEKKTFAPTPFHPHKFQTHFRLKYPQHSRSQRHRQPFGKEKRDVVRTTSKLSTKPIPHEKQSTGMHKGNPPYRHPFKTAIQMILKIKKSYPQKIPHINIIIVLLFKPYILFITLQGNGTAKRKGIFSKN
ncbi:TPA: hypothetical protein ACFJC0_001221 [Neisseria gonorrhoeae]